MMLHSIPAYTDESPATYTARVGYEAVHFGSNQKTECPNDAIFKIRRCVQCKFPNPIKDVIYCAGKLIEIYPVTCVPSRV